MIKTTTPISTPTLAATALGGLIAGAVTGATITAARSARKVKEGKITVKEAAANVAREAGSMGVAASAGVTATAFLGVTGVLSIASVALLTAGSKYAVDSLLESSVAKRDKVEEKEDSVPELPIDSVAE